MPIERKHQPDNLHEFLPGTFRLSFKRIPDVTYFCQSINIPGISMGSPEQPTRFTSIPWPGDTISFDPLNISFKLNENLSNWIEIYNWMIALGFPKNHEQFKALQPNGPKKPTLEKSDAVLAILDNKSKMLTSITYYDCFPTSLSEIQMDATAAAEGLTANASFKYTHYEFTG